MISNVIVLPHMRIPAHTRMGRPIRVYSYGTPIRVWDTALSHTRMGRYTHTGQNIIMDLYKLQAIDYIRSHNASYNVISVFTYQRSIVRSCYTVHHCCSSMKNQVPWEQNNRHLLESSFLFLLVYYCIVVYRLNGLLTYSTASSSTWR